MSRYVIAGFLAGFLLCLAPRAAAIFCTTDPPVCPVCQSSTCNTSTGRWNAC